MEHCRSPIVRARRARAALRGPEPRRATARCLALRICGEAGGPERIRTFDLCLRRAALYPAELRVPDRQNSNNPPLLKALSSDDALPVRNRGQPCHEKDTLGE